MSDWKLAAPDTYPYGIEEDGKFIAEAETLAYAEQIIREHNTLLGIPSVDEPVRSVMVELIESVHGEWHYWADTDWGHCPSPPCLAVQAILSKGGES